MVYETKKRLRAQLQLGMRSKEKSVVKERYKGVRCMKEGAISSKRDEVWSCLAAHLCSVHGVRLPVEFLINPEYTQLPRGVCKVTMSFRQRH